MSFHHFRQGELVDKPSALALAKFSYATTSTERAAPVNWTHLAGETNLFVVFERIRICGPSLQNSHERRLLKVQKGSDILEDLDLNSLVEEAAENARSLQQQNLKPAVAVIVKSPCLAVRYPTSSNQVRRFQLKFNSDADYYKALAVLSEVGCPITESSAGPNQHHISRSMSSSSQVPPSPSISTTSRYVGAPSPLSHAGDLQINPASSSLTGSHWVSHTSNLARDSTGEDLGRKSFYGAGSDGARVSTASPASSATACDPRSERKHLDIPHEVHRSSHTLLPPNIQPTYSTNPSLPPIETGVQHPQTQYPSPVTLAPPDIRNPESLSQFLPPKRELPFIKPIAKKPCTPVQRTPRKAFTSPLTTLSPAKANTNRPQMNVPIITQQDNTVLPDQNQNARNEVEVSHPPLSQKENAVPNPSSPSKLSRSSQKPSLRALPPKDTPSLSNANTQTPGPLDALQIPFVINTRGSTTIAPREIPTQASSAGNNPLPVHAQVTGASNPNLLPENRNTGFITPSDLSSYLQTPTPERSDLIESWVCQQLQDDGFLTLCEDVEGVWRRIAFGR